MREPVGRRALVDRPDRAALALKAGGAGSSSGGEPGYASLRSPECKTTLTAICDFLVGCGVYTQARCDDEVGSFFCDDTKIGACTDKLDGLACTNTAPQECLGLVDPGPPSDFCFEFVDLLCTNMANCDSTVTVESCKESAAMTLNCDAAVGLRPSADQCLADTRAQTCEQSGIADSCKGVVIAPTGSQ